MRTAVGEFLENRWLIFFSRLALGGILLAASVTKLQRQAEFIDTVAGYGILPESLAQFYGLVVPWVELFVGCSLILGIFTRFASALSIPLTVSFIVASSYALLNAVTDECGCFGELITLSHPVALSLDAVMLAMALLLLFGKGRAEFLSIGPLLSRYSPASGRRGRFIFEKASKLVVIALAMVVVALIILATQNLSGAESVDVEELYDADQESYDTAIETAVWAEIDAALEQDKPVFLYFYVHGCFNCEKQKLIIDELKGEYGERVVFMDVVSGGNVARALNSWGVPKVLLITGKDSEGKYIEYQRFEGLTDITTLREGIEQVLQINTGGE